MQTRWVIRPEPDNERVEQFNAQLKAPVPLAKILVQREVSKLETAKKYFRPNLSDLHDPFLMKDMKEAVERLDGAIQSREKILVYGDYDVDGTTSVALMYLFLKQFTDRVDFYIPDRYDEGYGISEKGIRFAAENDFKLIVALDCGIKAIAQVDLANSLHVDFIICDHHLPGETLPNAVAILDPKRTDCTYPYSFLSGCGVGFKLAQAYLQSKGRSVEELVPFMDLLAVSIAADIVPITGENRVMASLGLGILNEKPRLGLAKMVPNRHQGPLTISNVVFGIAPKINAAGRIRHAKDAVGLLISVDENEASSFLKDINSLNDTRKDLDADITEEAILQIDLHGEENKSSTVVYSPDWHKGVLGIVASRLVEKYYRPTVVFTQGKDDLLSASARSVKGFDVYEVIDACSDLLLRYGGHKYAAGLTMERKNYEAFKAKFEKEVAARIAEAQKVPSVEIDLALQFSEITPKFVRIYRQMAPFGPGNMVPVFWTKDVVSFGDERTMGKNNEHLRLQIYEHQSKTSMKAVAFGFGKHLARIQEGKPFDIAYSIEENHWQGKVFLQLNIRDIRFKKNPPNKGFEGG